MKKQILTLLFAVVTSLSMAQTAINFTCNDCSSVSHDLFTELNAGKVIVLCWVMPCAVCVGPSVTTYNVVESYASSHPNKVFFYLVDDYANTTCASLSGWAASNNLNNAVLFSNAAINMNDYGSTGMPKIVVIGGSNHTVFYNSDNAVNSVALQNAINDAIASATGIAEPVSNQNSLTVMTDPQSETAIVSCQLVNTSEVILELFSMEGKLLETAYSGMLLKGENKINLNLARYSDGAYLVKLTEGDQMKTVKFTLAR